MKRQQERSYIPKKQVKCPHCHRSIRGQNFELHELRCQLASSKVYQQSLIQQSQRPQKMKKPIFPSESGRIINNQRLRSERKKRQEYQKQVNQKIPCINCGYPQSLAQLDTHPNQCLYQEIECQFCTQKFPKNLMRDHYTFCQQRRNHIQNQNHHQPLQRLFFSPVEDEDEDDNNMIHRFGNFRIFFNGARRHRISPPSEEMQSIQNNPIRRRSFRRNSQEQNQQNHLFRNFNNFFEILEQLMAHNGQVEEQGLTPTEIKNLEKIEYKLDPKNQQKDICVICYCQFVDKEKILKLKCKHIFHSQCITTWLQKNTKCPVCKQSQSSS